MIMILLLLLLLLIIIIIIITIIITIIIIIVIFMIFSFIFCYFHRHSSIKSVFCFSKTFTSNNIAGRLVGFSRLRKRQVLVLHDNWGDDRVLFFLLREQSAVIKQPVLSKMLLCWFVENFPCIAHPMCYEYPSFHGPN